MAIYDVCRNRDGPGYLLNIQADLLDGLNTRLVAPLLPRENAPEPAKRLNPLFEIAGQEHVLVTQFMAAVPTTLLGESIGNLADRATEITDAIDFLTHGF